MTARMFAGYRPAPPGNYMNKGLSNGGWIPDYEGVIFSDGTVVIRWLTDFRSHSVWTDWNSFYRVHGHPEYGTRIEFADGGDTPRLAGDDDMRTREKGISITADAVDLDCTEVIEHLRAKLRRRGPVALS